MRVDRMAKIRASPSRFSGILAALDALGNDIDAKLKAGESADLGGEPLLCRLMISRAGIGTQEAVATREKREPLTS